MSLEEKQLKTRLSKLDICVDPHDGRCALREKNKCNREVDYKRCELSECPSVESCPCYYKARNFSEMERS